MNTIKVMDRDTGKEIDGIDSLRQRLSDCLSFPRQCLVSARGYGADLMALLDGNVTPSFSMDAFVAITSAINDPSSGLPDFKLESMGIASVGENHLELVVIGIWAPLGESVTLEGVRMGAPS